MAVSTAAARRYAEALFVAARNEDRVDAVERDLVSLDEMLGRAPQLLELMRNPLIPAARKQDLLERLLGESVQGITLRFLGLLVAKRRSEVLPHVRGLYREMADEHRGIAPAVVTSAVPLTPEEQEALAARLGALTGKQVVLHCEVDPGVIGGVRVHIGDTVLDGTVTGHLRQLRERLREALV